MTVMACLCLVLDGSRVNRDTTGLLFRRLVDIVVVFEFDSFVLFRQVFSDSSGESGFSVIDVTYTPEELMIRDINLLATQSGQLGILQ